jgi:hypothetical protein
MVIIRCFEIAVETAVNKTRQEESPITIKRTTTHGRIERVSFELIDGSAAISTAILKHLMMTISVETCSATVM